MGLRSGCPHSVVVYPNSTEDVVKIVKIARKYRMPVIPYSGGTSIEGHFSGVRNPPASYCPVICIAAAHAVSAVEAWRNMC
jgi:FAD binding domain